MTNPYVGPRPFKQNQSHLFFGREQEARDLFSQVVSERLLLFYATSGAGKSSILQTRLIPKLQEKQWIVLPVARVSGELPAGITQVPNIKLCGATVYSHESHFLGPRFIECGFCYQHHDDC